MVNSCHSLQLFYELENHWPSLEYLKCRKCVQIDFLSVNTIYVIRTIHGWLKQFIYYFKKNWGQSNPLRSQLQRKLTCLRENYMAHAILLLSEVNYLKSQKTNIFTFGQDKQALVFCYQNRSELLWEKIVLVFPKILRNSIFQNFWDL